MIMAKFIFNYDEFAASMKLIKKMDKREKKKDPHELKVTIKKVNNDECSMNIPGFVHTLKAEIIGNGSIAISIKYLLKILPTYVGIKTISIESISDNESLINGSLKVKTDNY